MLSIVEFVTRNLKGLQDTLIVSFLKNYFRLLLIKKAFAVTRKGLSML